MRSRGGFTIVELMVSMAIVGLLASLVAVAVQRSRATARRLQCANNLKQIGIAVENCVSSSKHYPSTRTDSAEIYQALGFPISAPIPTLSPPFFCPQDDYSGDTTHCTRSYAMNAGTHFRLGDDYRNGYMTDLKDRSPADMSDGLSQTAFFSERLVIDWQATDDNVWAEPRRYLWWTAHEVPRTPGNEPAFIRECETQRTSQLPFRAWALDTGGMGYDHRLPPNRPGCWNGPADTAYQYEAIAPASSNHSGGVNVLFGDGHITMVSDSVDVAVWLSLGTINGGDIVDGF
jgi:prepilin-type N-terminal cleavage/methylation domain-containing protein/prepilin-type processing-associated H-X9-DG protein